MKTLYSISLGLMVLIAAAACTTASQVQDQNKDYTGIMDSRNYIFKAQSVSPLGGRFRQLTSEYDLRVYGDSVIAHLPYFGRAYAPPADPTKSGIQFTSTNFEYAQTARKRGGWIVTIKPNDAQDVRELTLTISENGNATLQVNSNNRQAISFNGLIEPRR